MRIYEAEKQDGLEQAIANSTTATVSAQVKTINDSEIEKFRNLIVKLKSTKASPISGIDDLDHDLALVMAVLVSAGWNKNDDIFIPEELWKAKDTPVHKPMNIEHDEKRIVGHIIASRPIDDDFEVIDTDEVPEEHFHLESVGVVYKSLPAIADKIKDILERAEAGTMFVSMEAWFPDFAYGISRGDGKTEIVERTEATAFLTKHLRVFGGSGRFEDFKIGRVLKNINFGGQGFVEVPANLGSVITKVAASTKSRGGAWSMEGLEVLQKQLADLKNDLETRDNTIAELKTSLEEAKAADSEAKVTELSDKVETLTSELATANDGKAGLEAKNTELAEKLEEATKANEKVQSELDGIKAEAKAKDRMAKLAKVRKIDDEKATLAEIKDLSDEAFETVLKFAGQAQEEPKPEDEDKEEEKPDAEDEANAALDNVDEGKSEASMNQDSDNENERAEETALAVARRLTGQEDTKGGE